jgi:hypothetical protein
MSKIWYRCPYCFDENYHDTLTRCNACNKEIEQDVSIVVYIEPKNPQEWDRTIVLAVKRYLTITASAIGQPGARFTGTANAEILPTIMRTLISLKTKHHIKIQIVFL